MSVTILSILLSNTGLYVNISAQISQPFPNSTDLTNSSNITSNHSNLTNSSQIVNTTIPEQLPPESVNGNETGKI